MVTNIIRKIKTKLLFLLYRCKIIEKTLDFLKRSNYICHVNYHLFFIYNLLWIKLIKQGEKDEKRN